MTNIEKYNEVFNEIFNVTAEHLSDSFGKDSVESWDSVKQLGLVTALEETFDIMFEPEEILGFTSYGKGREILTNYDIVI